MESNDISPISSPSTDSPISLPITPTSLSLDPPSSPDIAHLDETNENGGKSVVTSTTSGRVFSNVWKHYEKEKVNGKDKAKCKYCSQLLLGDPKQGASHLKKHLERCPKRKVKDIRQQLLHQYEEKERSKSDYDKDAMETTDEMVSLSHLSDGHTHVTVFYDSNDENEEVVGVYKKPNLVYLFAS
ncbi:hypothetical protein DH2020_001906 [Rehmannia glutinosa]|uniref:BED-type domain-containing protein n=1 Tax=Rehmannia glutinosa TaxID=99300 RepID=A0ABR0XSR8_REHGL